MDNKDIIGWDVQNWSRALPFWERHLENDLRGKRGLEVGGREGGLSLWLASRGMEMLCTDLSDPGAAARLVHSKYPCVSSIDYAAVDAVNIPYEDCFDVIVFKSVLGGIGRNARKDLQSEAVMQMYKALRPGGKLVFAENLAASPFHRFFRHHFISWGISWRYITMEEMKGFLAPFRDYSSLAVGFFGAFGRNETQRAMLGVLDRCVDRFIPRSWRYIVIGVATK